MTVAAGPSSSDPVVAQLLVRCTFPAPGTDVDCAVSGGADSVTLAVLAVAARCRVTVHHVDHGLRVDSGAEAAAVRSLAAGLGAAFVAHRVEVPDGPNLEARARTARYAVLPTGVLTGHTVDDQAETILLQLVRGAGPTGVAAMAPAAHPLLALRRAETAGLCRHLGLAVVDDPMNSDRRFRRVRVRDEVLPLLDDVAGRDVAPLLARFADRQRELLDALDELVGGVDPTDAVALRRLPPGAATHVLRRWWHSSTGIGHPPDAAAAARMLAVVDGTVPRADVVAGWSLHRSGGRLRLVPPTVRVGDDVVR